MVRVVFENEGRIYMNVNANNILAGKTLTEESFKSTWERTARTVTEEDFATAFRPWYDRCEESIHIGGSYVRNLEKEMLKSLLPFIYLNTFQNSCISEGSQHLW